MKALLQRVVRGAVSVDAETVGSIGEGLVILLGVAAADAPRDADYLAEKTLHLRIFPDTDGKFDRSLLDTGGDLSVIGAAEAVHDAYFDLEIADKILNQKF